MAGIDSNFPCSTLSRKMSSVFNICHSRCHSRAQLQSSKRARAKDIWIESASFLPPLIIAAIHDVRGLCIAFGHRCRIDRIKSQSTPGNKLPLLRTYSELFVA